MKKIILAIILISCEYVAISQPYKRDMIKTLFPLEEIGNSIAGSSLIQSPIFHDHTGINDRQIDEFVDWFISSYLQDIADSLLNIYDSLLSEEEIRQLYEALDIPAVRQYFKLIPSITGMSIRSVYKWYFSNQEMLSSLLDSFISQQGITVKGDFKYQEVELKRGSPYRYRKPKASKAVYVNEENDFKVFYNNKIWSIIDPSSLNPTADNAFKMIDREVYAVILAEKDELNLKELRYAAVYNLYNASGRYETAGDELRKVNGTEILSIRFKALVNMIEINYLNYYYSGNQNVIQFSSFTGSGSYEEIKEEMQDLLNGLVKDK